MSKSKGISVSEDWEVENALRTLTRAREIQKDKTLMAKVKKKAQQKMAEMGGIASENVK